ncbi:hypothetical protein AB0H77_24595 [Streptomyces sp. NPDC050844]|uniref:hypothetical protein n=1 Tax=Streptomyces sp. NPDC050844 TaxID=3155790 RepID=UPI0033C8217D
MHTEHDHIRAWLTGRQHWTLGADTSDRFNTFLCGFPWTTSRVRWHHVPHVTLKLPADDNWEVFLPAFAATPAGQHAFTYLMYSWREPGIVCRTVDTMKDLDLLCSSAPGPRYFCGADLVNGVPRPVFGDFAEYDGHDVVTAYGGHQPSDTLTRPHRIR